MPGPQGTIPQGPQPMLSSSWVWGGGSSAVTGQQGYTQPFPWISSHRLCPGFDPMSCRMLLRWRSGSSMMRWRQSRSISTGLGGGIDIEELKQRFQNSDINWFPGHMVKATKRIEERIQAADLVIEVRDARVPLSSACAKLKPMLLNRRHIVILNKSDMLRSDEKQRWRDYFASRNVPMQFTDAAQTKGINALLPPGLIESGVAVFRKERSFLAMIIGIPNTGKSTLINALRRTGFKTKQGKTRTNAAATGARPGLTRHVSVLQYYDDPPAYLIDTPGVMNPRKENGEAVLRLALTGAIKDSLLDEMELIHYLLYIMNLRNEHAYVDLFRMKGPTEHAGVLLQAVGERLGFVMSRKEAENRGLVLPGQGMAGRWVKSELAATALIRMFRDGELGKFALDDPGERRVVTPAKVRDPKMPKDYYTKD